MAKDDQPSITLTHAQFAELLAAANGGGHAPEADTRSVVRDELAAVMSAKTPDQRIAEAMGRMRGAGNPLPPETLIPCVSPLTGATFTARVITSKPFPLGRIVELLDYAQPAGFDVHITDGGLYDGDRSTLINQNGIKEPKQPFRLYVYKRYWQVDTNALAGRPASHLAQWRAPSAPDALAPAAE